MQLKWWQTSVVYQIYPRSFMDSNGDGVGDLRGIIQKLDYLADLGIGAVWISPIFKSPMADFGYDVADYTDIDPLFGDLATFDELVAEAHERNIRVILDYVPNHSSDEHPWFVESRSSRDNPKRDWYIWRDPKPDGSPPNNWDAFFGGKAWEWDANTEQYYLHLFHKKQPDLNWLNPDVVEAMHNVLRFWMERGVDGFRMDVVTFLIKHPDMPDNPPIKGINMFGQDAGDREILDHVYDINQPEVHDYIRALRQVVDEYEDRVSIGETWFLDPKELVTYYGSNLEELHLPFNFILQKVDWNAVTIREKVQAYYDAMPEGAWPNFVLGSHDVQRFGTRFGKQNMRVAATLLLTLWGTPTWYYGDEIGMVNIEIPEEMQKDPQRLMTEVFGADASRDPERTPMQWDSSANAGFAPEGVQPWLPVAPDYPSENVETQRSNPSSMLNYVRDLMHLRKEIPALNSGVFRFVDLLPTDILGYMRSDAREQYLILLNFGGETHELNLDHLAPNGTRLGEHMVERLVSSRKGFEIFPYSMVDLREVEIAPREALIFKL